MSAPQRLKQVLLRREDPDLGLALEDVYWIDSELGSVGKRVRDSDGTEWVVVETYGIRDFHDVDKQHAVWQRWASVLK